MLRSFVREDLETLWKLGRIVEIKRLLDDLEVTAAQLMMLVYKLLLLVFKVNAAGYSQTSKAYIVLDKETIRIEESLNATFDESLLEPKSSSSVEYDRINEPIVQDLNGSSSLQVNVSNEGYPKSVKEARGHPIESVIGELNERTLRSKKKQALVFRMTISKGQMARV
ncbi:hypothetical protein Tco_0109932 [Tanacetum coccineum]